MFLEITNANYLSEYKILLNFNTGDTKIVDLKNELTGSIFEPLKDVNYFKDFSIKYNTIEWNNGADFAPEYLYQIGR
jgi:hypothetical protein